MFKNVASVGRHPLRGVTEKCAHPALPCLAAAKAVRHRCLGKTYSVGGPSEQVALDTGVLVLPQEFNRWIYFFRTTTNADRLDGELASAEIRRVTQGQP